MLDVYTLKSCDTCRKAIKWLASESIEANIIDIRVDGISSDVIEAAITGLGWEKILNRRSTSWRNLSDDQKQDMDAIKAAGLMAENATLMKRPLFVEGDNFIAGFDKAAQEQIKNIAN